MTETSTPSYAKGPPPRPYRSGPSGSASGVQIPLDMRVTLGDMPLSDAFEVTLPAFDLRLRMGELLERVFGPDGARDEAVAGLLDVRGNPDLHEMYGALLDAFADRREGRCVLRFFANHGPEMGAHDDIRSHLRAPASPSDQDAVPPVLDIVVEQRFTPLDYAAGRWHEGDRPELIHRLQDHVLLHFIGRRGYVPMTEPESPGDGEMLPIAARLSEQGAIAPSGETPAFAVTEAGYERLARAESEVEAATRLYDLFADVVYDERAETVEFGTGRGADLRVHVYEAEGLDAAETVLLRHLYDGTLDDLDAEWRQAVLDEDFFAELLTDLAERENVDPDALEAITEAGFAHLEELQEEEERLTHRRQLEARARRQ